MVDCCVCMRLGKVVDWCVCLSEVQMVDCCVCMRLGTGGGLLCRCEVRYSWWTVVSV